MKTYTITTNGTSNGNVISQPFTITIQKIDYVDVNGTEAIRVHSCTCNGDGVECVNDDVPSFLPYDLPALSTTKNTDLTNSIEVLLEEKYPSDWS